MPVRTRGETNHNRNSYTIERESIMQRSSESKHHSELGSNPLHCNVYPPRSERSLAASLRTIVRRVLRTNTGRNHFELRVLQVARRLLETQCRDTGRDALAKLIVENVLQSRRPQPASCVLGEDWVATQAFTPASTFAL